MVAGSSGAAAASHVLMVLVAVVWPIWDYLDTRALRAHSTPAMRLRYYRHLILLLWLSALAACVIARPGNLFSAAGIGINPGWAAGHRWLWWMLVVLAILFLVVQVFLPAWQGLVRYGKRQVLEPPQMDWLRFFLPVSSQERRWFLALGLSAGVCEEILCRGFFLRYFHTSPLHLNLVAAVLMAAAIFAAHHVYQGVRGMIGSMVTGLILTGILLTSGSLWPGIACHALLDISVLAYWRAGPAREDARAS